ncbi:putative hydrolase of the HAD superfamily [Clostridium beijerinckii]|uniref:HAD family hydrolase n=1 Tax=Clostridium beijerinckii TaxID=1520 RepID=UPI0015712A99|nr:HAD family phosphatase [Clostridium beijerinckii]NRT37176.1 putative hydrolase of the HAD superfamily [Clostridium beijerinckii]NRT43390.1 putative hydrolase of the HAD superfamily [Clostridium beijerinckii]NRZ22619.1 putative hydrolase of the HAD superfamily [Clostridium beijerinckii]
MIKNVIFDLGNVILDFQPKIYVESKIDEEKVEKIYKCVFQSDEWPMLDRGTICEEDAKRNIINRNTESEELINKVFENWYDILTPIESSVDTLKKLKQKGYKIYYLSNFHLAAFEYINNKYDLFKLFEGGVVSYKEKLLKPEKEIYEKILYRYSLEPGETLFIDDMEQNIEAAIKLGLKGIVLKEPRKLEDELQKFDINI